MSESIDMSKVNFSANNRNQRPPLLPTPSLPPRYNRNMSMNSDSSRGMNGPDDIESVDMEMSDDDTGMDNRSVGSSGGELSFGLRLNSFWKYFLLRSSGLFNAKHVPAAPSNQYEPPAAFTDARQRDESEKSMDPQSKR